MKKRIMILGASILQVPAIRQARAMGLEVIAVDMNENAVGFEEADIKLVISTIDIPKVVEAAKKYKINGVMTLASDMPMRTVAAVSKELGVVGIDDETALRATNKALMRQTLAENNVPIPCFFKVSSENDFIEAVETIKKKGFKCIVKPADNSGSRGVNLLKDFEKDTLKTAYEYSKNYSRSGDIVVEEYMEGPEVSVETLSIDGKCHVIQITDKLTTGAPYFVEMGHSQPSVLDAQTKSEICEVAKAANKAIGIVNGPSHTEIKVTKEGPKIVELGARLGGDNIATHLVPLSTGINMVECCIKIALNENVNIKPIYEKASAVRYFQSEKGVITRITGLQEAEVVSNVQQISIVHGVEECVSGIQSSTDRVGFVIAQANKVEDAISTCEEVMKMIKFEIKER